MKKYSLKIIYILLFSIFITACSPSGEQAEEGENIILQPESSNIINLAIDDADTLNPILTKSVSVIDAMQLVFEPLFYYDTALNPICALAESCIPSDDTFGYTVKIKDGVLWHDGTPLTAVDVLHTINLIRFNDTVYTSSLSCISSVSAIDNLTLSIRLNRPVPNFTALLSFPIVPNSRATEPGESYTPIGTGPFRYDNKITSDKIRLVVSENWAGTKPSVNEIHLNLLKNTTDIINAFNASEVDAITSTVMDLTTNAIRGEVYSSDYVSNNMSFIGFNTSSPLFMNTNTRKAISYLVDRQDIVTNEIFSRAEPAKIPVNPSAWYCPKIPDTKYDKDYISEMLALDGWAADENGRYIRSRQQYTEDDTEPVTVTEVLKSDILVNDDNDERYRIATKTADSLNSFGIETTVTLVSFEDYKQRITDKSYSMFVGEIRLPGNMDCYSLLAASDNYFSYSSEAMNNMIFRLGSVKNTEEQAAAFSEYADLFLDEMPFIPLFFRKETVYFEKNISGITPPNLFTAYSSPEDWYIINNAAAEINIDEQNEKQ